jgi:hypothetical protein
VKKGHEPTWFRLERKRSDAAERQTGNKDGEPEANAMVGVRHRCEQVDYSATVGAPPKRRSL